MLVNILIPTFQRAASLKKNLNWLLNEINNYNLSSKISIIISDNASKDNTAFVVSEVIASSSNVNITYLVSEENIGLEKNMVKLAEKANGEFILWAGDDDFLAEGYLNFVVESIANNKNIGYMISGLSSLHADGSVTEGRISEFDYKILDEGYISAYEYSHLAHQMSGLLMKRDGLIEAYLEIENFRNPYIFIYLTTNRALKYKGVYAPSYKTLVSVFNEKDWSYNSIGLLDEVFKNYMALSKCLKCHDIDDLIIRFIIMHSYRLSLRPFKPILIFSQYLKILSLRKGFYFKRKLTVVFLKESIVALFK